MSADPCFLQRVQTVASRLGHLCDDVQLCAQSPRWDEEYKVPDQKFWESELALVEELESQLVSQWDNLQNCLRKAEK